MRLLRIRVVADGRAAYCLLVILRSARTAAPLRMTPGLGTLWGRVGDALGFLFGDDVQSHEVRGTGSLARPGYDSENIFRFEQASAD